MTSPAAASGSEGTITVIDNSSLIAEINVPYTEMGKLKIGQSVPVTIGTSGDKTVTGVIDTISPDSDPKTNTYLIKVRVNNPNGDLQAGTFATISIPAQQKDNVLTVPNQAITVENSVDYIYTVVNGTIKKVHVILGIANDKNTEVTGSVQNGTEIITEGQNLLNNGEKVKVVN
jgi:RND family efflux transporter MFP subunit